MASGRTIAVATGLLVALVATGLLLALVLGDRSTDAVTPGPDLVEPAPRTDVPDQAPSLEGRPDARPLKTAALDDLLAALAADAEDERAAAGIELRERVRLDASLVRRLIERLDHVETIGSALRALAAIGAPAARPLAEWGLGLGQANGWRFRALDLLRRMGPEAAPAVDPVLESLPREADPRVRRVMFDLLVAVGPAARQAVPLLTGWLTPPLDDAAVRDAAVALAAVDGENPATLEVLRGALLDEETLARPGVLEAVARLGPAAAPLIPLLIDLLEDPEDATRFQAAAALGALGGGDPRVVAALVSMLEHDHQQGQRSAASALHALGPAGARALARVGARVEDVDVRLTAARALMGAEGHGDECARVLLSVLQEGCDKGWKSRALIFLAQLDPPPRAQLVLPTILSLLEDPTLAMDACRALANVPGDEARAALTAVLGRRDDPELGTAALDALLRAMAEDPGRDAFLASLLVADTPPARATVVLQRVWRLAPKGQASVLLPALEPWLAHGDPALRRVAHQGLARLAGEEDARFERLMRGLADGEIVAVCADGLRVFPTHAERSVPAIVEALLPLPVDSPQRYSLSWAPVFLARGWPGARAWIEARRETADEAGRRTLDELLSLMR